MNRFNQTWVRENFFVVDRTLHRVLDVGVKPVGYVRDNTSYVMFKGREYRAADVAWCAHTGAWPLHMIVTENGRPTDLHISNLLPITGTNHRCVLRQHGSDWSHNLSRFLHPSEADARLDWRKERSRIYRPRTEALMEADIRDAVSYQVNVQAYEKPKLDVRQLKLAPKRRPTKPKAVEGKKWHYYEGQWELTGQPCHVMDDYVVRAHSSRYLKATMRWSEEHGRVIAVSALTPEDVRIHKLTCDHKFCKALPVVHE